MTREELARLYRLHYRTVWNLCYSFLRDPYDVEDAVQDTFVKLALTEERFAGDERVKA